MAFPAFSTPKKSEPPSAPDFPEAIRDSVFFDMDGKLVIAEHVSKSPRLQSYVGSLNLLGIFQGQIVLPSDVFAQKMRDRADQNGTKSNVQVRMEDIVEEAIKRRASDIHIIDEKSYARIQFRVDGELQDYKRISEGKTLIQATYNTMTEQSDVTFNPNENQNARFAQEHLPKMLQGIRMSCGPHSNGVFAVLRLLYADTAKATGTLTQRLEQLGFSNRQTKMLNYMRNRQGGMIVFSGVTGSGKSTTLKHVMESIFNESPGRRVLTVEDPPEFRIQGAIQMPVKSSDDRGEKFSTAIREALRRDPDYLMIGEIRDAESAELAFESAMTGHQVWTSVHAGDTFGVYQRFENLLKSPEMPEPLNLVADASIISGVVHQKLIGMLCPHCKVPMSECLKIIPPGLQKRLESIINWDSFSPKDIFFRGPGCSKCLSENAAINKNKGIIGRTVIAEVIPTDPKLMRSVRKGVPEARVEWRKARHDSPVEEGRTLTHHAIHKIQQGILDPMMVEEVVGPLTFEKALFDDEVLDDSEIDNMG